jgi:hypothetical protein
VIETFHFLLPPTLNRTIRLARNNRYASREEKRLWTEEIARRCYKKHKFQGIVWIEFTWKIRNWQRDPDNTAASAKFICDGLVQAGIIRDDSLKIIQSPVLHWFEKSDLDSVLVRVADCPILKSQPINLHHLSLLPNLVRVVNRC